jgi:hypothetical protein
MTEQEEKMAARQELEKQLGGKQVWDTEQLRLEFEVLGFAAPWVTVRRKSDGQKGSMEFQHMPRFYYNFIAD